MAPTVELPSPDDTPLPGMSGPPAARTSSTGSGLAPQQRPRASTESVLVVSIPTAVIVYGLRETAAEFVQYMLQCDWGSVHWRSARRYSEFRDFHLMMQATACTGKRCGFPHAANLPPRIVTQRGNHNPANIRERRIGLEGYLRSLRGLCRRHQMALDEFLHAHGGGIGFPVVPVADRIARYGSHFLMELPQQMTVYSGLQLLFGDRCLCSFRRSRGRPPELSVTLTPQNEATPRELSAEAHRFQSIVTRLFAPGGFPTADEVRAAITQARGSQELVQSPLRIAPLQNRGRTVSREDRSDLEPRLRAHTLPSRALERTDSTWRRAQDDAGAATEREPGAATHANMLAQSGMGIRRTPSWQRMCTAQPPRFFIVGRSPQHGQEPAFTRAGLRSPRRRARAPTGAAFEMCERHGGSRGGSPEQSGSGSDM